MPQAAIVFEKSIIFTFSHVKAYVYKIDLAVKYVKVILGSSFDQTVMGCSPKCFIPSFVKIGLPVHEKKIFEWFLGHVTWIPRSNIRHPYPWMLHIKFQFDWPSDFRGEDL